MRNLHEKGFPVPEPLYLSTDADDKYFETVFFIRKYVEVSAIVSIHYYNIYNIYTSDKNIICCMHLC